MRQIRWELCIIPTISAGLKKHGPIIWSRWDWDMKMCIRDRDRIYAYQIFSGTRKPNRDKLLALGFGMELSIEEMQKMLKISEYPILYVKNKRDSIILFGLKKKASLSEVNELLYEMHENIIE